MTDPHLEADSHLEDRAVGLELQITELVEQIARASVQDLPERVAELQPELEALQNELAETAETFADEHWDHAVIEPS